MSKAPRLHGSRCRCRAFLQSIIHVRFVPHIVLHVSHVRGEELSCFLSEELGSIDCAASVGDLQHFLLHPEGYQVVMCGSRVRVPRVT